MLMYVCMNIHADSYYKLQFSWKYEIEKITSTFKKINKIFETR